MKLCYVTCESFYADPIIQSQVVPLLNELVVNPGDVSHAELITFEADDSKRTAQIADAARYTRKMFKRRHHFANLAAIFIYLVRHGRKFDVVHCRSYLPMLPVLLAAPLFRFKVIFDPRGLFADEVLYYKKGSLIGQVFKLLERWLYRSADQVITVSYVFTEYLQERYGVGARTDMISTFGQKAENGKKLRDIRQTNGWQDKTMLCYSGSLEGWQCIDDVINFFKIAVAESPTFVVLFLSKSEKEFRRRVESELPASRYDVVSANPKELPSILAQCDYGVLFREDHIVNRVAAPIKLKDYLCAGIKVVLTPNIGDSEEMIRAHDLGFVVDKQSSSSQLIALQKMSIVPSEEKKRIAAFADSFFSISRAVDGYRRVYRKVLGMRGANE